MSFQGERCRQSFICGEVKAGEMFFDERSKTKEHTDRFESRAETQKIKKTEENES